MADFSLRRHFDTIKECEYYLFISLLLGLKNTEAFAEELAGIVLTGVNENLSSSKQSYFFPFCFLSFRLHLVLIFKVFSIILEDRE